MPAAVRLRDTRCAEPADGYLCEMHAAAPEANARDQAVASAGSLARDWPKGYSDPRNATRSDFSCLVNPMPNRES